MAHHSINEEMAAYFPEVSLFLLIVTSLLGNYSYLHIVTAVGSPAQTHMLICINPQSQASPSGSLILTLIVRPSTPLKMSQILPIKG